MMWADDEVMGEMPLTGSDAEQIPLDTVSGHACWATGETGQTDRCAGGAHLDQEEWALVGGW